MNLLSATTASKVEFHLVDQLQNHVYEIKIHSILFLTSYAEEVWKSAEMQNNYCSLIFYIKI